MYLDTQEYEKLREIIQSHKESASHYGVIKTYLQKIEKDLDYLYYSHMCLVSEVKQNIFYPTAKNHVFFEMRNALLAMKDAYERHKLELVHIVEKDRWDNFILEGFLDKNVRKGQLKQFEGFYGIKESDRKKYTKEVRSMLGKCRYIENKLFKCKNELETSFNVLNLY